MYRKKYSKYLIKYLMIAGSSLSNNPKKRLESLIDFMGDNISDNWLGLSDIDTIIARNKLINFDNEEYQQKFYLYIASKLINKLLRQNEIKVLHQYFTSLEEEAIRTKIDVSLYKTRKGYYGVTLFNPINNKFFKELNNVWFINELSKLID
jgi:hypothetical protein